MRLASWVIAAALLMVARSAYGQPDAGKSGNRAVIDRADLEPTSIGGLRLRLYVSALNLDGQMLDLTEPKSIRLLSGNAEIRAPFSLGTFAASQTDLAMVVIVQGTIEYSDALPLIADAFDQAVLANLNERAQVAILTYGEAPGGGKLASLKAARGRITQMSIEGATPEPSLLDTVDRALLLLKRSKTEPPGRPMRKMIVVISDGRDKSGDRERVTRTGERAAREGVRIHSFGYSPLDVRRPLLLLGELSKRSAGTFRWLLRGGAESWPPRFQQLRDEINQQYVLTYFIDSEVTGQKLKIATTGRTTVVSTEIKAPAAGCNGEPCEVGYCAEVCTVPRKPEGRGIVGWIITLIGIGVGLVIVLGVVGFVMAKRQQRLADAPAPGMPGSAPVPGSAPPVPGSTPPGKTKKSKPPKNLPSTPPAVPVPAPQVTSGPRLYIMTGPRAGEQLGIRHGFLIGAAPTSDLLIADGFASTHHAQIGMDPSGNCWLADLGSTNGTFVNGVRITQKTLDHGVTVKIGSTELRFLSE